MKRVLITGAASGIGAAAAAELRSRGAHVIGLDLRGGHDVIECDVRDAGAVERGVGEAIERLGGLDVLVNNAGVGTPQSAGAPPDDAALAVVEVNLIGPWRVTSAALPALLESRGRVVNVASGLSHLAVPFGPAYCMSKRGVVAYSDSLRLEYGDAMTVTTVYPGYIRTAIHDASREGGFGLEGLVPAERLENAARLLADAALGPPARDLATTRRGAVAYALARRAPRRLLDGLTTMVIRRHARRGHFDRSEMARDYVARLRAGRKRRRRLRPPASA